MDKLDSLNILKKEEFKDYSMIGGFVTHNEKPVEWYVYKLFPDGKREIVYFSAGELDEIPINLLMGHSSK